MDPSIGIGSKSLFIVSSESEGLNQLEKRSKIVEELPEEEIEIVRDIEETDFEIQLIVSRPE